MKRHHFLIANLLLAAATVQAGGPKSERSTDAAAFAISRRSWANGKQIPRWERRILAMN